MSGAETGVSRDGGVPWRDPGLWAAVAIPVLAHAWFLATDVRLPRDLGQFYRALPRFLEGDLASRLGALVLPGGWYTGLRAGAMTLVGGSLGFGLPGLVEVGACTLGCGLLAQALATRAPLRAGRVAALVAGASPGIVLLGRQAWIHVPELALVLFAALLVVKDAALGGVRTRVGVALIGLLALALRPSAIPWLGTLALLVRWRELTWRSLLPVGLAWAVGLAVQLPELGTYLSAKALARERYAAQVPPLGEQLGMSVGWAALLVAGVSVALASRESSQDAPTRGRGLLVAWVAVPLLGWTISRAGLDNFPVLCAAVAVAAGLAASRLGERSARIVTMLAVGVALRGALPVLVPAPGAVPVAGAPGAPPAPPAPSFAARLLGLGRSDARDVSRPWTLPSPVVALLEATCPDRSRPCFVAVDEGLFTPRGEDPGALQLAVAGLRQVEVVDLAQLPTSAEVPPLAAMTRWFCGDGAAWARRFPGAASRARAEESRQGLRPAWDGDEQPGCVLVWLTPEGVVADPMRMPTNGRVAQKERGPR